MTTGTPRKRSVLLDYLKVAHLVILCCVLGSGCGGGGGVAPSGSDTTPPSVALDAFNVPIQAGAASAENPVSVTGSCCNLTRRVHDDRVDLVAAARDSDGVVSVGIWVSPTVTCIVGGLATKTGPPLLGAPEWENRDTSSNPPSASTERLTNGSITLRAIPPTCPNATSRSVSVDIWVTGTNFAGAEVRSKTITLIWNR